MRSRRNSSDIQPTRVRIKFLVELADSSCWQITYMWLILRSITVGDEETDVNLLTAGFLPIIWLSFSLPFTFLLISIKYIIMKVSHCDGYLAAFGAALTMICVVLSLTILLGPDGLNVRISNVLMGFFILFATFILPSCSFELCHRLLRGLKKRKISK